MEASFRNDMIEKQHFLQTIKNKDLLRQNENFIECFRKQNFN